MCDGNMLRREICWGSFQPAKRCDGKFARNVSNFSYSVLCAITVKVVTDIHYYYIYNVLAVSMTSAYPQEGG